MNQFQNEMLGLMTAHEERLVRRPSNPEPERPAQPVALVRWLAALLTALLNLLAR